MNDDIYQKLKRMDNELQCPFCNREYSQDNIPRLFTACGHTFCHQCFDYLLVEEQQRYKLTCPEDQTTMHFSHNDISQFPKNIALLKLIQAKKAQNSGESFKDESLQITKIIKNDQSRGNESEAEILSEIEQGRERAGSERNKQGSALASEGEICLVHQKPLQVVCLVDLQKICTKCAIFGGHNGHQFKSLEEIDQDCNNFKESLLTIERQKEKIEQSMENKQNSQLILSVLQSRKQLLQKDINDRYRRLVNCIKRAEEESMKRLEEGVSRAEEKLRKALKMDWRLSREFDEWQRGSMGCILKILGSSFQERLELLYRDNTSYQFLEKGEQIVEKMKQKQDSLIGDVEYIIESIKLHTNEEVYRHIDKFATIRYEEPTSLPSEFKDQPQAGNTSNHMSGVVSHPPQPEDFLLESEYQEKVESSQLLSQAPSVTDPSPPASVTFFANEGFRAKKGLAVQFDQPSMEKLQRTERPPKKKLKSIKVPEKFEKQLEALYNDTLDTLDLTNSQVGDGVILQICDFLRCSKVRVVKLIRCKLSDEVIGKILPVMGNIITLNLSQNYLTEAVLGRIAAMRESMPALKTVILCQNKIIERKHRVAIQKLRQMDLIVSV